jgi:aldose 1-epimerase
MKINCRFINATAVILMITVMFSCTGSQTASKDNLLKEDFGTLKSGEKVELYTLTSATGLEVKIMTYGGTITSILAPDKDGKMVNVTLGYDNFAQYEEGTPYFGALIGRYGNRIAGGQFTLDGQTYNLAVNNGPNHLHGGIVGFDKVVWDATPIEDPENPGLKLSYLSADGEEGYPGNLKVTITYLLKGNDLEIHYEAETDKATPVNLTNHAYYNLAGEGTILDHILTIDAGHYIPVDEDLIPTGEIAPVADTPFDFNTPYEIGARIEDVPGGYDHTFVLSMTPPEELRFAAKLKDPKSGRTLEIYTTEPGIQFYSGNFLDGTLKSGDFVFEQYAGLCLETQHFPDSPNQPEFPSTILHPGEKYETSTMMRFGVE